MKTSTTFFEQVPLEVVDEIMRELLVKTAQKTKAKVQRASQTREFADRKAVLMCDTGQRDGSIKAEQDDALTQVPLPESRQDQSERGEENWRRLAKLAEVETDPDKLLDLAQQLVNELDRETVAKFLPTLKSSTWRRNSGGGAVATPSEAAKFDSRLRLQRKKMSRDSLRQTETGQVVERITSKILREVTSCRSLRQG